MMDAVLSSAIGYAPSLHDRIETVLNQWFHFGKAWFTTRLPGLSLVTQTQFGVFHSLRKHDGESWWHDDESGLELQPEMAQRCDLIRDRNRGTLRFDLSLASEAELSVLSLSPNEPIARQFEARDPSAAPEPWLDEWTQCSQDCGSCQVRCQGKVNRIRRWREIEISVVSSDLRFRFRFRPNWIDRDLTVLRLSDAGQRRIIHLDLASPFLTLRQTGDTSGELLFNYSQPA